MKPSLFVLMLFLVTPLLSQEQVDKSDPTGKGSTVIGKLAMRVRVAKSLPDQKVSGWFGAEAEKVWVDWLCVASLSVLIKPCRYLWELGHHGCP